MFKLHNYNIILPKYLEIVKKKGVPLSFPLGGWDKEKIENSAKKLPSEARAWRKGVGEFRHARANTKSGQPRRPAR